MSNSKKKGIRFVKLWCIYFVRVDLLQRLIPEQCSNDEVLKEFFWVKMLLYLEYFVMNYVYHIS